MNQFGFFLSFSLCLSCSLSSFANYSLEDVMAKCDYAVVTLGHDVFKNNKELIASKPYYDCVGLMR